MSTYSFNKDINRFSLRFKDKELERSFHYFYVTKYLWQLRLAHILAALFFLLAVSSERYLISFDLFPINLRLLVVVPSFIAGLIITFLAKEFYRKFYKYFNIYYVLLTGISFILTGMSAPDPYKYSFYSGLMISLIFNYTFIKQDFIKSSLAGLILIITFFILAFRDVQTSDYLIHVSIYISVCNILGMFIAYAIEYDGRKSFTMINRINSDAETIKDINRSLEWKVKKRTSELQIQKLKAEESDRIKSTFLGNMSHEIRTPMNSILGYTDLLREDNIESDLRSKYLQHIEEAGERLMNLLNDILRVSEIESGIKETKISPVDINEQMRLILNLLEPEAQKKGIKVSIDRSKESDTIFVETDRDKLYTVLSNLVKNAIKFTDHGEVVFGYQKESKNIQFFVKDTGIGIEKSKQDEIFERFVQGDIEDKMARQGSGLGLAISKAFVEILGGEIWLESKVNVGSSFYFTLPINK